MTAVAFRTQVCYKTGMRLVMYLLTFLSAPLVADDSTLFQQANTDYEEGVHAASISQQERAFNNALRLYLQLESPDSSAVLNDQIGNSYYHLGRYGWAILYYLRALRIDPRHALYRAHLHSAEAKLDIPPSTQTLPRLSWNESTYIAIACITLLVAALSTLIWWPKHLLLIRVAGVALLLTFASISILLYQHYVSPVQAVVIQSTHVLDADQPLLEGTRVAIQGISEDGQILLIRTASGQSGHVSFKNLRIL